MYVLQLPTPQWRRYFQLPAQSMSFLSGPLNLSPRSPNSDEFGTVNTSSAKSEIASMLMSTVNSSSAVSVGAYHADAATTASTSQVTSDSIARGMARRKNRQKRRKSTRKSMCTDTEEGKP